MAFHVRDPATDFAGRRLARITGKTLTETIREAVEHEYAAINATPPLIERLQAIQADFGKGHHPAGLNMGDRFAYACTKQLDAPPLCKGNDFPRTDVGLG